MEDTLSLIDSSKHIEVVSACDLNPKYLNCIPLFIASWNLISRVSTFQFAPRIALIAQRIPSELAPYEKYLGLIDPGEFSAPFVAQNIRLFMGGSSNANLVITSDIDMLPASARFYEFAVMQASLKNNFIIVRDVLPKGEFPICYNIASPQVWSLLFGPNKEISSPEDFLSRVTASYDPSRQYSGLHGGQGWNIDQRNLYDVVTSHSQTVHVIKLVDSETKHRRLDRIHHRSFFKWFSVFLVPFSYYSDYHVHHPVDKNKRFINFYLFMIKLQAKWRA